MKWLKSLKQEHFVIELAPAVKLFFVFILNVAEN